MPLFDAYKTDGLLATYRSVELLVPKDKIPNVMGQL